MGTVGWKIYDPVSDEYYRGAGRWGKTGKLYGRKCDLTAAIKCYSNLFKEYGDDFMIIEYRESGRVPFRAMYDEIR